ncbi:MAG TPA: FlgD immunoglobulin-like domain containing protein [Candidatus Krumholzibacteria bacterium]|nr:FlgD immunoglobulin-like domain containing protein [Candidatus Krumholzibacteria bacterium]
MLRFLSLSTIVFLALPASTTPSFSQCLQNGDYTLTPAPSYSCKFGTINFSVQSCGVAIGGNQITVTPSPGPVTTLLGTIDCQTGVFSATATIPGGCAQTYTLTGQVQSTGSWTGTFQAQFLGGQCSVAGMDACTNHSFPVSGALTATGVQSGAASPSLAWIDVAPNPFVTTTILHVHIDRREFARVVIRDVRGSEVARIVSGTWLGRGDYTFAWDGRTREGARVPSGVYFAELHADAAERVAKLVVLN